MAPVCSDGLVKGDAAIVKVMDIKSLQGRWLHSHEEDTAGHAIFRPESHPLPPSRGRRGYEFFPDGRLARVKPGPSDRTAQAEGTWTVDTASRITIRIPGEPDEVLEIESLEPGRLVVKK